MGCDIHCVREVKTEGHWLGKEVAIPRWHQLFGLMAGVRSSSVDPIKHCRGMPNDASTCFRLLLNDYGKDAHSTSYLTRKEVLEAYHDRQQTDPNSMEYEEAFQALIGYLSPEYPQNDGIRVCFFFDS